MLQPQFNENMHLIAGSGDAAKHILCCNWSLHSMGQISEWPMPLRNNINFMLNSWYPMFLFWGDEHFLFYNSKWLDVFEKEKSETGYQGQPATNVFGAAWKNLEPLINTLLSGNESLMGLDHLFEYSSANNAYVFQWNLNFCPVYSATGKTAGVLATINEIDKVPSRETIHNSRLKLYREIAQLNTILETSGLALLSISLNGTIESWNEGAGQIFGYTQPEIIGKHYSELFADAKSAIHEFNRVLKNGGSVLNKPYTATNKWDVNLDVLVNFVSIRDSRENLCGATLIIRNISEQKQTSQKLQETEDRLQLLLVASELGTWELHFNSREVTYSKKYLEILGYKGDENPSHEQLLKHIYPADIAIREKAMQKALEDGILNYEFRIIRKDEATRWIEARGQVLYSEDGSPLKLTGTFRDITDRRLRVEELRESEKKFRLLADSVPQLIWTGDPNGNLSYFNLSFFEYSGLTPKQIHKEGWIQIVHPDDRLESVKQWAMAIDGGESFLTEHRFKRYDGSYRWHLSRAIPQKDSHGNIQMWVGTSTDVHDQKVFSEELEKNVQLRTAELKRAIEDLTKTNQELEQFAYVSSHDLQEPLRKIQTFSGIVSSRANTDEESKIYLNKINASAGRMSELIRDLLDYSKLSRLQEHYVETDLNTILDKVKNDFEVLIQQKKAIVLSARLPVIRAVPIQMNQLFYNLIGNSLKFCEKKPFIEISVQKASQFEVRNTEGLNPSGKYYHFAFRDNGIGFSQEYAEQIFTIFQRLNEVQKYSGTGIGLAMCKKIVENHNGHIKAHSEPGKGATFNVYLPY